MNLSVRGIPQIAPIILAAGIVLALKQHYSLAGSNDLDWILEPTTSLVRIIGQVHFAKEAGAGYLSVEEHAVIAPACAGINFLIATFSMVIFQGFIRFKPIRVKLTWLLFAFIAAYILTVHINAFRIVMSLHLYQAKIYDGWITPERVHRIIGCGLYFISFSLLYFAIEKLLDRILTQNTVAPVPLNSGITPLLWYLLFALIFPFINNPFAIQNIVTREHYAVVFSISVVVFGLSFLIRFICHQNSRKTMSRPTRKHTT